MKRISLLVLCLLVIVGCASGAVRIDPNEIKELQTAGTENGSPTSGCVSANINATSGVVGGNGRAVVTWGDLTVEAVNWCIGK